jgi:ubiquitin carboxyl-terminal hydrolase 4/11/15
MNGLPSPAQSPSLQPTDTPSSSRKRQRSDSMQSANSSTSVKRPVSEPPTTQDSSSSLGPKNDDVPTTNLLEVADDIDSYMALQDDISGSSAQASIATNATTMLSKEEKLAHIESLKRAPMMAGETWYLVSRPWYRKWHNALSGKLSKDVPVEESDLGPVDNRSRRKRGKPSFRGKFVTFLTGCCGLTDLRLPQVWQTTDSYCSEGHRARGVL